MTESQQHKLGRALREFASAYGRLAGLQDAIRAADRNDRRYPPYLILREIEETRLLFDESRGMLLDIMSGELARNEAEV